MIEAPTVLQKSVSVPQNHYDACIAQGIPTVGNAAGNDKDFFDLTGVPTSPAPLPDGFMAKGIVALVFSILAAILGMAVISWLVHSFLPSSLSPFLLSSLPSFPCKYNLVLPMFFSIHCCTA